MLKWAAETGLALSTHDASTMTQWGYARIGRGVPMPGIVEVSQDLPLGQAIEDLTLLAVAGLPEDCDGKILYLPLLPPGQTDPLSGVKSGAAGRGIRRRG